MLEGKVLRDSTELDTAEKKIGQATNYPLVVAEHFRTMNAKELLSKQQFVILFCQYGFQTWRMNDSGGLSWLAMKFH